MLDKLKAAGFNWLAIGIEAGDGRVRADVDKGFGQDEVFRVIKQVQAAGINVIGNYIFGLPEDDHETMQATLDMAIDLNCEFANFYSAMAYPGSPLYSRAVSQGLPLPEKWTGYSQHSRDCLPLPTRYLTAREVLRFRDAAFNTYYSHPRYLGMLGRKFGTETVAAIREMTRHRLKRALLNGDLKASAKLLPRDGPSPELKSTVEVLSLGRHRTDWCGVAGLRIEPLQLIRLVESECETAAPLRQTRSVPASTRPPGECLAVPASAGRTNP